MLIDWITARIPVELLTEASRNQCLTMGDRITRYCPKTGDVRYESAAWDSIASDSHQINIRATAQDFWIMGSPARIMGDGCAVFGSAASARLDLPACVDAMRLFVQGNIGIELPADVSLWKVSRVDVTANLCLGSLSEVRDALKILRDCEGGRYRVSQQAGDTVYWSQKSKLRKGKAYAKGPHLAYQMGRRGYSGREYTRDDIETANKLLRLELTLGREFWARNQWQQATADDLRLQWHDYFDRMIGGAEVTNDAQLKERIFDVAPTEGRARAAYGCWLLIQAEGWERARESFPRPTWYRHLKILRAAGLGDADLSAGNVVRFRQRIIETQMVTSWHQLKQIA